MADTVNYDAENDILVIHKGFDKDERFKGNIDIGDIVLDISTKSRIRGVEIMNASRLLRNYGIQKELLSRIKKASLSSVQRPEGIFFCIGIRTEKSQKERKINIGIPTAVPVGH